MITTTKEDLIIAMKKVNDEYLNNPDGFGTIDTSEDCAENQVNHLLSFLPNAENKDFLIDLQEFLKANVTKSTNIIVMAKLKEDERVLFAMNGNSKEMKEAIAHSILQQPELKILFTEAKSLLKAKR